MNNVSEDGAFSSACQTCFSFSDNASERITAALQLHENVFMLQLRKDGTAELLLMQNCKYSTYIALIPSLPFNDGHWR